jgi:beta-galactosidase
MRHAGFTLVRMGDLSWDAFEPLDGDFRFAWFDEIQTQMDEAGIKVILDIGGLPAPIWLHTKHPSINIVNQNGVMLQPARRYMEDISDPVYREHVKRFADALTRQYANHPALLAVGYDNEIGDGYMSYSTGARLRFIEWLKAKYGTVEALNKAWATQRWSRQLCSFNEVQLPNGEGPSPPERFLDLHRFWSDRAIGTLMDLEAIRRKNMPELPSASNLWDTAPRMGFDYLDSSCREYASYGALGLYPGNAVGARSGHVHEHPQEVARRHGQRIREGTGDLHGYSGAAVDPRADPAQPLFERRRREGAGDARQRLGTSGRGAHAVREHDRPGSGRCRQV